MVSRGFLSFFGWFLGFSKVFWVVSRGVTLDQMIQVMTCHYNKFIHLTDSNVWEKNITDTHDQPTLQENVYVSLNPKQPGHQTHKQHSLFKPTKQPKR